jgi:hypothetical protein
MAKYHLRRSLIIATVAVALPLTAVSVGVGSPSAAASVAGAAAPATGPSATSAPATGPAKAVVPANAAPCTNTNAVCAQGGEYTLTYIVTGTGDCSWTANIVWGDGTTDTVDYGSAGFTEEHTYAQPGLYNVSVTGSGESTDPDTTCTFFPDNVEVQVPLSCADTYQTVVTVHGGDDNGLPQLDTDTVTLSWCTDGQGHFQILSSKQVPTVQQSGLSFSGAQIAFLNFIGFTFSFTPTTVPAPTIDNEFTSATTTASGFTFNQQTNLGPLLSLVLGRVPGLLWEELLAVVRSGQLVRLNNLLSQYWSTVVAGFQSFAARNFGLPAWAADFLLDTGIGQDVDLLTDGAKQWIATAISSLEALGNHPTLTSVVNAVQSATKKFAAAIIFTTVEWTPQITITVDSGPKSPSVAPYTGKTIFDFFVEDPIVSTQLTCSC